MDVYLYFVERLDNGISKRILIEDWKSVLDCLSSLDGTCEQINIARMRVCSKDD